LDEHAELLGLLEPRHMSGDESVTARDRLHGVWLIVEAEWQSEEMKDFLRKLDTLYRVYFLKKTTHGEGDGRGHGPRERIATSNSRIVDSEAPEGLWRNCYSKAWLDKQRPHFVKDLNVREEQYDFSL
ncbi:hypothetical protein C8Q79DRAFT_896468, partial [Trametes meyenii]